MVAGPEARKPLLDQILERVRSQLPRHEEFDQETLDALLQLIESGGLRSPNQVVRALGGSPGR